VKTTPAATVIERHIAKQEAEIARLRGEIDERKAIIADMRKAFAPASSVPLGTAGLSRKEAEMVSILFSRRGWVRSEAIYASIYGAQPGDGPDPSIVKVHLSNARKKLAPLGVTIHSTYYGGYRLDAEGRATLERLIKEGPE
jgi:DNA-binding response OmpR family regulator